MKLILPVLLATIFYSYGQNENFTYSMSWDIDGIAGPGDTLTHLVLKIDNFKNEDVSKAIVLISDIQNQPLYEDTILPATNNTDVSISKWSQNTMEIDFKKLASGIYNFKVILWYESGYKTNILNYNSLNNEFTEETID